MKDTKNEKEYTIHDVILSIFAEYQEMSAKYIKEYERELYRMGECKFPSNDCKNISGKLIKINEKITSSDLRVIKWLTGLTVDCEFKEIEFISDKWKC